ncbi:hypothetical protein BJ875DRAFT_440872 [Amylocarpus encephaloides]|uniref:Uncharacterized protein n=1 Tax=Amylocarpus encephaloides TaxID=45428 RepID=A0A9P7YKR3_9HELO|nr:hypothetical protein BJ875DRAFT_440872 [Amylocarpus encephaloides]
MCYLIDTIHSHCNHYGRVQVETACANSPNNSIFAPSRPSQEISFNNNPLRKGGCWRNEKLGGMKNLESYCEACLYRRRNGLEGLSVTYRLDHPAGRGLSRHCALTRRPLEGKPLRGVKVSKDSHTWDWRRRVVEIAEKDVRDTRLEDEETLVAEAEAEEGQDSKHNEEEGRQEEFERKERTKLLEMWNSYMRPRHDEAADQREETVKDSEGLDEAIGKMEVARLKQYGHEVQPSDQYIIDRNQGHTTHTLISPLSAISDSEDSISDSGSEERDWESLSSVSMGWEDSGDERPRY